MLSAGASQAASLSYYLDQSNSLADGPNYLQVTIADGADGAIDFTVEVLNALAHVGGSTFGIQSFALNGFDGSGQVTNLTSGWSVANSGRMDGFGSFDLKLAGNGSNRLETLTFSIVGVDGDTPEDYARLSSGNAAQGQSFFAAHVVGYRMPECQGRECANSGFFGGSNAVPLPPTAWLLGAGIIGALTRARRRRS